VFDYYIITRKMKNSVWRKLAGFLMVFHIKVSAMVYNYNIINRLSIWIKLATIIIVIGGIYSWLGLKRMFFD
jgi:hypothetical protein